MALADVVDLLCCPHCAAGLTLAGGAVRCASGHTFDVARQGYVSLLTGRAPAVPGDTAAMVAARATFLGDGHLGLVTGLLADAAADVDRLDVDGLDVGVDNGDPNDNTHNNDVHSDVEQPRTVGRGGAVGAVLDLGAGTGQHLAGVLDRLPAARGIAADVSGYALRRAARAHPRSGAVRCDAWQPLPVRDGAVDLVLNVFAPRNGPEIRRVLRPGGRLLVVTPLPDHLAELASVVGAVGVDPHKADRLEATLAPSLEQVGTTAHRTMLTLTHAQAVAAVAMGPAAWHVEPGAVEARVRALPEPVSVTVTVTLSRYRRPT